MNKIVRDYIKKKINNDDIAYISDGKNITATISVCRTELGDGYMVDVVRDGYFGKTYEYDTLTQCFGTLSRLERENLYPWRICANA